MKILALIKIVRPTQWLKNLMLLFPPLLGGSILRIDLAGKGCIPLLAFCLASSATYVFNDILDAESDAVHPVKCRRPIPAGILSVGSATVIVIVLLVASILISLYISRMFTFLLIAYLVITTCYSLKLKTVPIVDIFCISAGFVLRLQAGGEAFRIGISEWLFLSVFFLSVFLSTGKRLCEMRMLGPQAALHRKTLADYPSNFLEGTLSLTGATVLVTYTMYSLSHYPLIYTVPLCTFGLLRYSFRVKSGLGGDPTDSLLNDLQLFITSALWAVIVGWSVYR